MSDWRQKITALTGDSRRPWRRNCTPLAEWGALLLGLGSYFPAAGLCFLLLRLLWPGLTVQTLSWTAGLLGQLPAAGLALLVLALSGNRWELNKKLGLRPLRKPALRVILGGFLLILVIGNLLTWIWRAFLTGVGWPFAEEQDLVSFALQATVPELLLLGFALTVTVPMVEEFLFRRLLYGGLLRFGAGRALVLSSLIFGGVHLFLLGFPMLAWMGAVLQFSYRKTRNLWVPIAIHGAMNLSAVGGVFLQKYVFNG